MSNGRAFTIFGGTGDLTFRKLLPAFYNIEAKGDEKVTGRIIIIGRKDYTSESYREQVRGWVKKFARLNFEDEIYQRLAERMIYYRMEFTKADEYVGLENFYLESGIREHIFYFAVDPRFFGTIVKGLQNISGAETGKVVIEKPFGENLQEAEKLNTAMEDFFGPRNIYRIDHYLGKEMVRNIQTIRFTNPIFSTIWDARHIECIQISATEEVGVETRGAYYDHSGALKDMMQNHLLQILTIVAMEQPVFNQTESMHKEQMKVLRALRLSNHIARNTVLARYEGYREEPAVANESKTETYAALRLFIDNDRWRGMPFYIRTGKKLNKREMQVSVMFKPADPEIESNILKIKIQPTEGVYFQFNIKRPGETDEIVQAQMDFCQSCQLMNQMNTPEAYERLISACVHSESAWFSQWDQIDICWKYVNALRKRYHDSGIPVYEYAKESEGPDMAEKLLAQNGHTWLD